MVRDARWVSTATGKRANGCKRVQTGTPSFACGCKRGHPALLANGDTQLCSRSHASHGTERPIRGATSDECCAPILCFPSVHRDSRSWLCPFPGGERLGVPVSAPSPPPGTRQPEFGAKAQSIWKIRSTLWDPKRRHPAFHRRETGTASFPNLCELRESTGWERSIHPTNPPPNRPFGAMRSV